MKNYDFLIVGAGISGAVLAERLANDGNKKVLVIDKRDHIAGNCFDYKDNNDILCHKYGPHIFHTNSSEVFNYLSKFTEWAPYVHRVMGLVDGLHIPIPFNFTSIDILFDYKTAIKIKNALIKEYEFGSRIPISKMIDHHNQYIRYISEYIYNKIFYNYTKKQWGMPPEKLNSSVLARVPVAISYDDRYFADKYQVMPKDGYTNMIKNMLNSKNIDILLSTKYEEISDDLDIKNIIYTGKIDEFYGYKFGRLEYRSIEFIEKELKIRRYQPVATVNYPNNHEFTRITEMKHFYTEKESANMTKILIEYPKGCDHKNDEPYYPVHTDDNINLYKKYLNLRDDVTFCGRLGDYKYYNMDQAVARSLHLYKRIIKIDRGG